MPDSEVCASELEEGLPTNAELTPSALADTSSFLEDEEIVGGATLS